VGLVRFPCKLRGLDIPLVGQAMDFNDGIRRPLDVLLRHDGSSGFGYEQQIRLPGRVGSCRERPVVSAAMDTRSALSVKDSRLSAPCTSRKILNFD